MSWQHLRSYEDWYLVSVHTHGDFIVLPHIMIQYRTESYYPDSELTTSPEVYLNHVCLRNININKDIDAWYIVIAQYNKS